MRKRRKSREIALQFLYQVDVKGKETVEELESFLDQSAKLEEVKQFSRELISGVIEHQDDIDNAIIDKADNWQLHRMAVIDRNILRVAAFELIYKDDIPPKVSINEAIEIAKKFSTKSSAAFVNGILDKVSSSVGGV